MIRETPSGPAERPDAAAILEEVARLADTAKGAREVMDAKEAADFLRVPYSEFKRMAPCLPRCPVTERRYVYYRRHLIEWLLQRRQN